MIIERPEPAALTGESYEEEQALETFLQIFIKDNYLPAKWIESYLNMLYLLHSPAILPSRGRFPVNIRAFNSRLFISRLPGITTYKKHRMLLSC